MKRLFDFISSLLSLILLCPLFIIIALLIKLTSVGPIFFMQERIGQYGRIFRIYKFRTMRKDAEKTGQLTIGSDSRITGFGHLLRKTNMDELPQLINVLKGEMSLVGPRPEVPKYVALYTEEQKRILNVKPGMTNYASLRYRNENEVLGGSENPEEYYIKNVMPEKLALDLEYLRHRSFFLDFKLILLTILDIIKSTSKSSRRRISKMISERIYQRRFLFYLTFDSILVSLSMYGAFYVRFDGKIPDPYINYLYIYIMLSILIKISWLHFEGLYYVSWTHMSLKEYYSLIKSIIFAFISYSTILFFLKNSPFFSGFPKIILVLDFIIVIFLLGSYRFLKRIHLQYMGILPKEAEKVLIIGAGYTGENIVRSMQTSSKEFDPIGFLDDDRGKIGSTIHGIKVLGKREEIVKVVKKHKVESILIAMPKASSEIIRETIGYAREAGVTKIRIIPSFDEIISGKITFSDIKEVGLEDLLGRERVEIDTKNIEKYLEGKNVLVSGASGSIGTELCNQILKFNPKTLIAFDQDETGLFYLRRKIKDIRLKPVVGNIRDVIKMNCLFQDLGPQVVFHAAAYKHVPVMEEHPDEAVKNNIFGTLGIGEISIKYGVKKFILVSTDKAVNPTSVMGVTKRIAEKVIVELNKKNGTQFAAVRFGNVLGSRGSVIPIFREQILKGGPVEVTHPDIKRYFMLTSEAVLLILQAGAMAEGGEVFVLDMGEPIKIIDLARDMIRLSGFEPDNDIPIIFTGLRRGEKLYEDLLTAEEGIDLTLHKKISKARLTQKNGRLSEQLEKLKELSDERKNEEIISLLREMVPTYNPSR